MKAAIRFLTWRAPFLPAAAQVLLNEAGRGGVLDLGATLLVVPGARAGRRLLELLVEGTAAAGVTLVPPRRILTVGALPEELYRSSVPLASGHETRRGWARALGKAPPRLVESLFGRALTDGQLQIPPALARLLFSLSRTIGAAGRTFREVAKECGRGLAYSDEERWNGLSQVQEEAWRMLRDAGRMDRDEARRAALGEGDLVFSGSIVLLGVVEIPPVTRRFLERASGEILALVHAPEELAEGFDGLGALRKDWWSGWKIPLGDSQLVVSDQPSDQAREAMRFLSRLPEGFVAEDITLGVSDRSLAPDLLQALEAQGLPQRYAEGTPLALSPPAQFLSALEKYLSGRRFGAMASLLRHPDLPAYLDPGRAPELADAYFQNHLPALAPEGPFPGERRDQEMRTLVEALHGEELLGSLRGQRLLRDWAPALLGLLARVYGSAPLRPDRARDRVILEACLGLRDAGEALSRLPPLLDGECTVREALQILLDEVAEDTTPPPAEEAAVEVVGWLEVHMDDAPVLVLTGVNDPYLPEAVSGDPFLPDALRTRLGLEDNEARWARDAYRLTAVLESRPHVFLIAGRQTASGDPLRPSRLLLTGSAETVAGRLIRLLPESREGSSGPRMSVPGVSAGGESGFRLPPKQHLDLPQVPEPLPVTAFRAILEDPYLWVLEGVLGLTECADDLQEMDPLGFGTLAHRVLERFAHSDAAGSEDPEAIRSRLDRILDTVSRERFGTRPLPTVPLQVEALRSRLAEFARWQASWSSQGWRIHCVEARTPPQGVPFDVDGVPLLLSGRVDRIDRNEVTGAWAVLDYKTGESRADAGRVRKRDGRWTDLQLPLYRYLLDGLVGPDGASLALPGPEADVELGYLPLSKDAGPVEPSFAGWTRQELEEAWEVARGLVRSLRAAGAVFFDPRSSGRRAEGALGTLVGRGVLPEWGGEG